MMNKVWKRLIAVFMSLAMAVAFIPVTGGQTVSAEDVGTRAITLGTGVLATNCNTNYAATVRYGNYDWRVIGYDGNEGGVASETGKITMLSARELEEVAFDTSGNNSNVYKGSNLESSIRNTANSIPAEERSIIVQRTLVSGTFDEDNTDCIAGDPVDALLWPLSQKEANDVSNEPYGVSNLRWGDNAWWLRSPGGLSTQGAGVFSPGRVFGYVNIERSYKLHTRPAFHLDFSPVLFTSKDPTGKVSGREGKDALTPVSGADDNKWKFTIKDDVHSSFAVGSATADCTILTVPYSGAVTGDNEYISSVIVNKNDQVIYYGRLAKASSSADASVEIDINGKMQKGDRLYLFNEQFNGEGKTDFASELQEVDTAVAVAHDWEFTGFTWAKDGKNLYKSAEANYVCRDNASHKATVNADLDVTEPGSEDDDKYTYVATVKAGDSLDRLEHHQTKCSRKGVPSITMDMGILPEGCNSVDAATVTLGEFRDQKLTWNVIGYNGSGVASSSGNATLLAATCPDNQKFNVQWTTGTSYNGSNLQSCVNDIAGSFSADDQSVIIPRTLEAGSYNGESTDCVGGDPVENALLWPLSTAEAYRVDVGLRSITSRWWLRSPGNNKMNAGSVSSAGYILPSSLDVDNYGGVRTAFNLDLGKVLFLSPAEGGKVTRGEGLNEIALLNGDDTNNKWKLTIKNDAHRGFTCTSEINAGYADISYEGAATGENEYISAIIRDDQGFVTHYGRIMNCSSFDQASGTTGFDFGDKLKCTDTLYVFNEQVNGENESDYASDLNEIIVPDSGKSHSWGETKLIQKSTLTKNGRVYHVCSSCGLEKTIKTIPKVSKISLARTSFKYTGKIIRPKVIVKNADGAVVGVSNYMVTYSANKKVGKAKATVTFKGAYYKGTKELSFTITKAANPLKIKAKKNAIVKYKKLKKKNQTLKVTKVMKFVKKTSDKKTYKLSSAKKAKKSFKKYFTINKKTGKVTVKKGLKKGTYRVTVKVKAAGNANYKASLYKKVTFKVRVR